jgi:MFS transporter, PPP family, 3-phenylpropionic acid transporter
LIDKEISITPPLKESGAGISSLLHSGGMYLGYYMAIGALVPFINLYYERLGLTGGQIGLLAALPVLITASTAMMWGWLADAFEAHRTILRMALIIAPLSMVVLSFAQNFALLLALVAVYAFFFSAVLPLIDSAAIDTAKKHKRSYGDLRVWGTIGWSISTWLIGKLIENHNMRWMFYGYAAFMGLTLLISLFQPAQPQNQVRTPVRHGLRDMLARPKLLLFLLSMFLTAITGSAVSQYMGIFLDRIGGTEGIIGLAASVAALSEIPVMFASRAIMKRIGAAGLLITAFAVYSVRWLLLSFAPSPMFVLALQLMHGLSFGAFLIGGVTYMHEHVPSGLRTTSQALFNSIVFGLASVAGSLLGGLLYDRIGFPSFFRLLSIVAAVGLLLLYFTFRIDHKT